MSRCTGLRRRTISAMRSRALGERESGHGASRGGGFGLSRGVSGADARACPAGLGCDTEQSRHCALEARRAGERHGASGGGGFGLSRGASGADARACPAGLGQDAEQSRQCAFDAGRAGERARRAWRRRFRPIVRRWWSGCASVSRWTGPRRRTISALRFRALGERESGTARLEEAVSAYRAALQEWRRERVPLDWAMTQNNLGLALSTLGAREAETDKAKGCATLKTAQEHYCGGAGGISAGGREPLCGGGARQCCAAR